jgi:hypothetical protein
MCDCRGGLEKDEDGAIAAFIARNHKGAATESISFEGVAFPLFKSASGSLSMGCVTTSTLKVKVGGKVKPVSVPVMHGFCPFCGGKYGQEKIFAGEVGIIDPFDAGHQDQPIYCVYGPECFPTVFCCTIIIREPRPAIWGYSVYEGEPSFRTLGRDLHLWIKERTEADETAPKFLKNQDDAFSFLRAITIPQVA